MRYSITILLLSTLLLVNCSGPADCESACAFVNPSEDMVGYLNPNDAKDGIGTLFVRELYLPEVLAELNAVQFDEETYMMTIILPDGLQEEFIFEASFTDIPYLFSTDADTPEELKSKYKVFINAECKREMDAEQFPCEKYRDIFIELEARQQDRCRKGSSICTEVSQVIALRYEYADSLCTILTGVTTENGWDCN